jgi:hypothetical protein
MSKIPNFADLPLGMEAPAAAPSPSTLPAWKTMEQIDVQPFYSAEDLAPVEHLGTLPGLRTPIQYMPLSVSYNLFREDKSGTTQASTGIVFALHWPLGLTLTVIWLTMAYGFKISSLAALVAAVLMPLGMFYIQGATLTAWAMVPIAVLLIWRHRDNIRKLRSGRERSIGRS